jgi:hypothetical protein
VATSYHQAMKYYDGKMSTMYGIGRRDSMLPYKELENKDDDNEYIRCIYEAAATADEEQLQLLFATILSHCEVSEPKTLWESTCHAEPE